MTIEDQPFFFHAKHYRATNPDLEQLSDEELLRHFYERGIDEGRAGHRYSFRDKLIALAQQHDEILEIGPFFAPCLEGPQVTYFDVLGKQDLIRRALELGYDTDRIPEIDYVSPTGDLSIIDRRFPALLSSHCIEHQPDLIAHLQKTYALLEPGGCYYLMIPDKRFCYDHFLGESNLAEVLEAHEQGRKRHTLTSVIEHRALKAHNDSYRHWDGDHGELRWEEVAQLTKEAIREYREAGDSYIDVHAWQFTPLSFSGILRGLRALDLLPFEDWEIYNTFRNSMEFTAILRKAG